MIKEQRYIIDRKKIVEMNERGKRESRFKIYFLPKTSNESNIITVRFFYKNYKKKKKMIRCV